MNSLKSAISKSESEHQSEVKQLSLQIETNKDIIKSLDSKVSQLTGTSIFIENGNALPVGNSALKVGVSDTNPYSNTAKVVSGDFKNGNMAVGESFHRVINGNSYTVTLVSVKSNGAAFSHDKIP